ncbi:hypothetical protein GQX74_011312, partial [Glossina fuscipes]
MKLHEVSYVMIIEKREENPKPQPLEMSYLLGTAGGCLAAIFILICLCIYALRVKKCCFKDTNIIQLISLENKLLIDLNFFRQENLLSVNKRNYNSVNKWYINYFICRRQHSKDGVERKPPTP